MRDHSASGGALLRPLGRLRNLSLWPVGVLESSSVYLLPEVYLQLSEAQYPIAHERKEAKKKDGGLQDGGHKK